MYQWQQHQGVPRENFFKFTLRVCEGTLTKCTTVTRMAPGYNIATHANSIIAVTVSKCVHYLNAPQVGQHAHDQTIVYANHVGQPAG